MKHYYNSVLLFFVIQFAFSQIGFQEIYITDGGDAYGATASAAYGDLDGDGDLDALTSHYSGFPGFVWYENIDGLGTFGQHKPISSDFYSASGNIVTVDFDDDGDLDVLASTYESVVWFENTDGLGNFSTPITITDNVDNVTSINSADLDGDGDFDVMSTSYNDNKLAWYENLDGLGTFGAQQIVTTFPTTWPIAFGEDMDGDGDIDIIASLGDTVWFENVDGNGTFTTSHTITTTEYNSIFPKDLDQDGDIDIIVPAGYNDDLVWYENINGFGDFSSVQNIDLTINGDVSVASADDFDGDGDIDILINGTGLFLYVNDGNENFSGGLNIMTTTSPNISALETTDINNDGNIDILAGGVGTGLVWLDNANGTANFNENYISFSAVDPKHSFAADMDNDGDLDVLTATSQHIAWFEDTNGNQNYDVQHTLYYGNYLGAEYVAAYDFDGDSDLDVVVAFTGSDKIYWYENLDSQGSFGDYVEITNQCDAPKMVFASDLDGDGDLDLLSASRNDDKIAWYENVDGQGSFGSQQIISSNADGANFVEAVDIDNDGDMDVVSASITDDKIAWYENVDGQGTFGTEQFISTDATAVSSLDLIDFDNDGDIDVLSGSSSENKIAWFENLDGQGTFSVENTISSVPNNTVNVYAVDIDNDSDLDAVSMSGSNRIVYYENVSGVFDGEQIEISPGIYSGPTFISTDLDNDGDIDFISVSDTAYNGQVIWHKNLGRYGNEISGTVNLDVNDDNCSSSTNGVGGVMIIANNDNTNDSFSTFSQNDGTYQMTVNEGDFTVAIAPSSINNFNTNPASQMFSFGDIGNDETADFCLETNGSSIDDLNIVIYPSLNDPRPGFDTSYHLVYSNVGNTQLNGSVTFEFDNSKLQFLSASETATSQTSNLLTFNVSNLNPFDTRTIDMYFNVFAPPTTNIDDVLVSTATINPIAGDQTEDDNVYVLDQTVIGSYDPNDITCLEGDQLLIEDADKYLHYVIRFQNTGTASAINVKVDNVLDDKLDWTSMQLESLSHEGRVEILNGNEVSFIFANINLPDSTNDEPNSHGFIAYKIKPLDNVVLGDIFYNTADIYFDFNPAIVTNTAETEIVDALSVADFQSHVFSVFPNPTKSLLTIESKIGINKVRISDINGRVLNTYYFNNNNQQQVINVENLSNGIYFLKLQGVQQEQVIKFIKN